MKSLSVKFLLAFLFVSSLISSYWFFQKPKLRDSTSPYLQVNSNNEIAQGSVPPEDKSLALPREKILQGGTHSFQTFNNCGPAALSMAFSFYGINVSQKVLGEDLRPYQIKNGDNDDKSVTLPELAEKSKEYGFVPFYRPNGNIELIKNFVANGIPVITKTLTKTSEDIGHYRVVYGYSDFTGELTQSDSLQGKGLKFSYDNFLTLWKPFGFQYLVLVPSEKVNIVSGILGSDFSEVSSWASATQNLEKRIENGDDDPLTKFSLSVAYYNTGRYGDSIREFEQIKQKLPKRTLWYQIEPIRAHFELGQYDRVLDETEKILNGGNRAFSELYVIRGDIFSLQGKREMATDEYKKAVYFNKNLKEASDKLKAISKL